MDYSYLQAATRSCWQWRRTTGEASSWSDKCTRRQRYLVHGTDHTQT